MVKCSYWLNLYYAWEDWEEEEIVWPTIELPLTYTQLCSCRNQHHWKFLRPARSVLLGLVHIGNLRIQLWHTYYELNRGTWYNTVTNERQASHGVLFPVYVSFIEAISYYSARSIYAHFPDRRQNLIPMPPCYNSLQGSARDYRIGMLDLKEVC